jgi:hypothetical protein
MDHSDRKNEHPVMTTMTLRDQFAMAALIAAMNKVGGLNPAIHAENAYFIADAMLEARKEKK